ncbi:DUF1641 domain-containing protein [Natronobacterium gregoryi]|uniref:DUF1641 domain-containing protein n=2 Tax=Natronobacterium gregoryi TaxID=44930 RepID=L0AK71_NATGS|nr:DUF1641 domain-containing protein [Natronobacterium gregoryi]AFZ74288.1 hypothetical protein Natgr_3157 [Natronobacterium gregoryi SP2]ELY63747.1 hypothetical protein C490_15894 [Natronobacterium gregoryi SP2]PLK22203.1 DUF1641 domain-containing protein [Natronobacterium gregoryi SP2]SFI53042.1 Uncharacterized conserved protein YjgD, DUF1641 family [Natronobacterium gregoryi]
MAQRDQQAAVDGTALENADATEFARTLEEHDKELAELLEMLVVVEELSADLAPELREAAHDSREPIAEVRTALEREEMLVLVQRVGENADTLVELLETLEVVDDLAGDLVPELKTVVRENRETFARLRTALEREETLTLLERLGENEETLIELLELLEVTYDLAEDLVPEAISVVQGNRRSLTELRMIVAGMSHAYADSDLEPYQLGQNLGNMLVLGCQLGDEQLIDSVEAGLGAFTDEEPPKKVGLLGLMGAIFDDDVRQGLGVLLEFLRRMGAERAN